MHINYLLIHDKTRYVNAKYLLFQVTTSFCDATIENCSIKTLKLCDGLNQVYNNQNLRNFLNTFVISMALIKWIKAVTLGMCLQV